MYALRFSFEKSNHIVGKKTAWRRLFIRNLKGLSSLSIRAIGEKHGINHATIFKRADKEGWQRDLTDQVRTATGPSVLDDSVSAWLTDAARRDYFTLRERIEVAGKQIAGLQQYIREQCINRLKRHPWAEFYDNWASSVNRDASFWASISWAWELKPLNLITRLVTLRPLPCAPTEKASPSSCFSPMPPLPDVS